MNTSQQRTTALVSAIFIAYLTGAILTTFLVENLTDARLYTCIAIGITVIVPVIFLIRTYRRYGSPTLNLKATKINGLVFLVSVLAATFTSLLFQTAIVGFLLITAIQLWTWQVLLFTEDVYVKPKFTRALETALDDPDHLGRTKRIRKCAKARVRKARKEIRRAQGKMPFWPWQNW